ncbi:MAG: OmpA family protein [Syntrophothermus sp.]
MKTKYTFLVLLMILSISLFYNSNVQAQTRFGIQYNQLVPANEFPKFKKVKDSFIGRAFLRWNFSKLLMGEIGAGYGIYAGLDYHDDYYQTTIVPVDFRLELAFSKSEGTRPYIFAGVGGLYYKNQAEPRAFREDFSKEVKKDGITGMAPLGLGLDIKLGPSVAFDLNAGVALTLTDDLNYYKWGSAKDAYYFIAAGFLFGGGPTDKDKDGLLNSDEEKLGTDPNNPDTDGDGLLDGQEVLSYKTDPKNPDTDADGLKDGAEVKQYKTDPLNKDTDGDGLGDGQEVNSTKTNPLDKDTDADGLTDGQEVNTTKTDPLNPDTDKDGLKDGDEVNTHKTDPLNEDTDNDGLKDGEEVTQYNTNPLQKDTDKGTVDDGKEVGRGTNPNDPNDDVVKVGVPIVLEGINFATGKADITPESEATLQKALKTLTTYPDIIVEISGHTDNVGSNSSNQKLSQRRADSVKKWLVDKGIDASRITAKGYGEDRPIAPNDTKENKFKNRRIEFVRIK